MLQIRLDGFLSIIKQTAIRSVGDTSFQAYISAIAFIVYVVLQMCGDRKTATFAEIGRAHV